MMKRLLAIILLLATALTISACANKAPVLTAENSYQNPVLNGYADPDVLFYEGTYYLYGTGGTMGYHVHTSKDLVNWTWTGVVAKPGLWGIATNYWAPDVEYINGKFYMVTTCEGTLGLAVSDSPLGPFSELHDTILFEDTIDGHLFVDDDGAIYLYYVSWRKDHPYGIYGVKLDEQMRPIEETETLILMPAEDWEKDVGNITEGPYMLKHNGLYYLTYSGSHFESKKYAVGYAISDTPLGTYTRYEGNPILIGNEEVSGTGHHCVTTSPDGKDMWIVYHRHDSPKLVHPRNVCIDPIRFVESENGPDILEVHGPSNTPQLKPSPAEAP